MSINAHYMVLFKNQRDVSQFANLARQMYPKTSQFTIEAYRDATGRRVVTENKHFSRRDSLRIHSNGIKRRCIRRQIQCMSQYRTKMSRRVKKLLPVLRRIRKMGDKARRDYIKKCNREFIDCVSECAKNVIKGNVPMSGPQKAKLRRRRRDVRALATKKTSLTKKRRILQNGGFLTALLPPVLSGLSSMFLR